MLGRPPDKTKDAQRKPRRYGSQSRFRSVKPFFCIPPVKENQELEVAIDDFGSRGDGINRIQSFMIFIPSGKVGKRAKAKILLVREKFAVAEKIVSVGG